MKVAIAGVWHVHAGDYTRVALKYGEVVGVYDDNAEWRSKFAKDFGIPEFSSYDELLASDAEGIIVCAPTNKHAEVIVAAANAGKHIFTEKVLALNEADCNAIKEAVESNGVKFVISFPWKFNSGIMALKKAADDGLIGKINYLRFRNCHNGSTAHWLPAHFYNAEECGGGAMIDLGAHGMYLTHWFLGEPISYTSAFTHACRDEKDAILNPSELEDNALTAMTFENGAIAVNETGFVSTGSATVLEVGGDTGYLIFDGSRPLLKNGNGVTELPFSAPEDLPIARFMNSVDAPGCGLDEALALTRMMVGAYGATK